MLVGLMLFLLLLFSEFVCLLVCLFVCLLFYGLAYTVLVLVRNQNACVSGSGLCPVKTSKQLKVEATMLRVWLLHR